MLQRRYVDAGEYPRLLKISYRLRCVKISMPASSADWIKTSGGLLQLPNDIQMEQVRT